MTPEQKEFLNLRRWPARLTVEETALALNFTRDEIALLVGRGLLRPLGKPLPNSIKWFSASAVKRFGDDEERLSRGTAFVQNYWRQKNHRNARRRQSPSAVGAEKKVA